MPDAEPAAEPARRLRILFAAPNCLLDPSSGAAQSCRTILERLAARGHAVMALTGTVFDQPEFETPEAFLASAGAKRKRIDDIVNWHVERDGIRHVLLRVGSQLREQMTGIEETWFFRVLMRVVVQAPPDLVLTFGGQVSDLAWFRLFRDRHIPSVFYLANPNYFGWEPFRDMSAVITDSAATARLYKERFQLDAVPVGKFVRAYPSDPADRRDFVTFLNPIPAKGVALFAAIAQESARRGLGARFLVVEGRGRLAPALERLGIRMEALPNVTCWPVQQDMATVWARTRLLLHPSLWHESGSRSILEALSAGIPCLATRTGGTGEILADSGSLFPNPLDGESAVTGSGPPGAARYLRPFPPEAVAPWVDRIEALLTDDALYRAERARARAAWDTHPHRDRIELVERMFLELAAGGAKR